MIRSLTGTVTHHVGNGVILNVHDIGYLVVVPLRALPAIHTTVTLFTHHHVREDVQALYGFQTLAELMLFERLLDVSSIGPKSAMAVLSVASVEEVSAAIETDNAAFFSKVPGLGKKSALKIIVELKGKLAADAQAAMGSTHRELLDALQSLGYATKDIQPLLQGLPADFSTEAALTWVLQRLGR